MAEPGQDDRPSLPTSAQVSRIESLLSSVRDLLASHRPDDAQVEASERLEPDGVGAVSRGPGAVTEPVSHGVTGSATGGSPAAASAGSAASANGGSAGSASDGSAASATGGSAMLAALELENSQLKQALENRAVIEQAKGMLMSRHGCDADAAFQLLVMASRRDQRKVRDVAIGLVTAMTRNGRKDGDLGVSVVHHPGGRPTPRPPGIPAPNVAPPGQAAPTSPRRVTLPPDSDVPAAPARRR